jgi:pimeloyl-ACP methyl ester carboxylesterase
VSGGVVALRYLCTHPETVSKALTHEPALLSIMPEKEELKQFAIDIYELYKKEGRDVAMIKFGDLYCNENDKQMMRFSQGEADPERVKNSDYWFEHQLWQYPTTEFDWGRVKTCSQDKLIPVCGVENKGFFLYKPNALLAELTGTEIFIVPGGHFGYLTHAEQFAKEITEKLKTEHVI